MKFAAQIDKKYTVWQRLDIEFEAKNKSEAKKLLAKWDGAPKDRGIDYISSETLYYTEETVTKKENGNQDVWELKSLEKV